MNTAIRWIPVPTMTLVGDSGGAWSDSESPARISIPTDSTYRLALLVLKSTATDIFLSTPMGTPLQSPGQWRFRTKRWLGMLPSPARHGRLTQPAPHSPRQAR